jgi:hypothetical protein
VASSQKVFLSGGLNPGKPAIAGQWLSGSGKYTLEGGAAHGSQPINLRGGAAGAILGTLQMGVEGIGDREDETTHWY